MPIWRFHIAKREEERKKERREGNFLKIKILLGGRSKFKKIGGEEEENFNI